MTPKQSVVYTSLMDSFRTAVMLGDYVIASKAAERVKLLEKRWAKT